MYMNKYNFPLLLLLMFLYSCTNKKNSDIEKALCLSDIYPDSTLSILEGIDVRNLDEEYRAKYSLANYWAMDKCGYDIDSDSLIRYAYNYYNRYENPVSLLFRRTMYYMGKYYSLVDSTQNAEFCFKKSIKSSEDFNDTLTEVLASEKLTNIMKHHDLKQAEELSIKALNLYREFSGRSYVNLVWIMLNAEKCLAYNHFEQALQIGTKALELAKIYGDSSLISAAHQDLAFVYNISGKSVDCLIEAKKAYSTAKEKHVSITLALADAYYELDSLEATKDLLKNCKTKAGSTESYGKYALLQNTAIKEGQTTMAIAYSDSAFKSLESVYHKEMANKIDNFEKLIEMTRTNAEIRHLSNTKTILFICSLFVFFIITLSLLYIYLMYRRHADERLKTEQKIREIVMANKDAQISIMRNYISEKISIRSLLSQIKEHPEKKINLSEDDWNEIEIFLESSEHFFVNRLKNQYTMLSEEDIRLLMLLRLNLPAKSLAMLYGISETSVKHKLLLFKKKIGLEGNSQSLRSFVESF